MIDCYKSRLTDCKWPSSRANFGSANTGIPDVASQAAARENEDRAPFSTLSVEVHRGRKRMARP